MLGEVVLAAALLVGGYAVLAVIRAIFFPPKPVVIEYKPKKIGDITLEELSKYDGSDVTRPLLFAVKGRIFDVSEARSFYGPGAGYSVFAGREIARALGKLAICAEECNDKLDDLSERELQVLADWESKFEEKYTVVGQVVPPLELTREQLAQHDGSDPGKPLLLAIRGLVLDVSKGSDFYGPEGAYPFAGHECARALAKFSTEAADLNDNLEGCTLAELDALRDWTARLAHKYPIVGRLKK